MREDTAPAPLDAGLPPKVKTKAQASSRPVAQGGRWLLTLFALPFALTGWGLLLLGVVPTVYDWVRVQSWQATPATLTAAELRTHRNSKSTSYSVTATYRYRVDNRDYTGQRVALSGAADNVGDFQAQLGRRLSGALRAGKPVTAWVNPSDPQQALLDRSLRPGLLSLKLFAALLFGGFGTVILVGTWRMQRRHAPDGVEGSSDAQPRHASDAALWRLKPEWADNRIRSTMRHLQWAAWFVAVFVNAIALPVAWMELPKALRQGNLPVVGVMALFALAGIWVLAWALRMSWNARRFGDLRLSLDPFPGAIGGHVGGTLVLPVAARSGQRFSVALECVRRERVRNQSRAHEAQLWQREGLARTLPVAQGVQLSLRFDVPQDLPPSTVDTEGRTSAIVWRLSVRSADPGFAFERVFEIPVLDTGERSADLQHDATQHAGQSVRDTQELERICRIEERPGEVWLHFPMARRWQGSASWLAMGALFTGCGLLARSLGAPLVFPIAFSAFGLPLALAGLYMLSNSLRVQITPQGFRTERRLLGVVVSRHEVRRNDLRQLQLKKSYSTASGSQRTTWYRVQALRRDGRRVTLADSLRNQGLAQHLLERLQKWPSR